MFLKKRIIIFVFMF